MLLDDVLKQNSKARFVLCTPFVAKAGWRGEHESYAARQQMINNLVDAIHKIGKDYPATIVPFNSLIEETIASTPGLPVSYWIWDGIHPTPAMHHRMASLWIEVANLRECN